MKLEYAVPVQCSPERLWQVFTQAESWPAWSKLVKQASWTEGPAWVAGSKFLIEIAQPQFKLKAEAAEVSAPHAFTWKGTVMGVAIEHRFDFAAQADGSTLAKSSIQLSGPAVFFINEDMKRKGLAMFAEFMNGLKQQAESC
jgi:uncharacterized protein YndB with AHSA1/START domain